MYEKSIINLPVDIAIFSAAVADFKVKQSNLANKWQAQ